MLQDIQYHVLNDEQNEEYELFKLLDESKYTWGQLIKGFMPRKRCNTSLETVSSSHITMIICYQYISQPDTEAKQEE